MCLRTHSCYRQFPACRRAKQSRPLASSVPAARAAKAYRDYHAYNQRDNAVKNAGSNFLGMAQGEQAWADASWCLATLHWQDPIARSKR